MTAVTVVAQTQWPEPEPRFVTRQACRGTRCIQLLGAFPLGLTPPKGHGVHSVPAALPERQRCTLSPDGEATHWHMAAMAQDPLPRHLVTPHLQTPRLTHQHVHVVRPPVPPQHAQHVLGHAPPLTLVQHQLQGRGRMRVCVCVWGGGKGTGRWGSRGEHLGCAVAGCMHGCSLG